MSDIFRLFYSGVTVDSIFEYNRALSCPYGLGVDRPSRCSYCALSKWN